MPLAPLGDLQCAARLCPPSTQCHLQVQGLTKKGARFFHFGSPTTEPLRHLAIAERHIWAAGEYQLSSWVDGADAGVYTCPNRIMAAEVCALGGGGGSIQIEEISCKCLYSSWANGNGASIRVPDSAGASLLT